MTAENNPCPFCGGTDIRIEAGGQIWSGQRYSEPQYYHLYHNVRFKNGDGFQTCSINIRTRTAPEAYALWQGEGL